VLAAALGASNLASPLYRAVSHSLVFGLHLGALMTLSICMGIRTDTARARYKPLERWAPVSCIVCGSILMLLDLIRHLLLDQDLWPIALHMYNMDGSLTCVGVLGVVATWLGLSLVVIGIAWFLGYDMLIWKWLCPCSKGPASEQLGP